MIRILDLSKRQGAREQRQGFSSFRQEELLPARFDLPSVGIRKGIRPIYSHVAIS